VRSELERKHRKRRGRAKRIAYVPQRPSVASAFSAREVIALGQFALMPDPDAIERVIDRLSLGTLASRTFAALSVGEQQRVSLARALVQLEADGTGGDEGKDGPRRFLLADEPTSAMDPRWVAHTTPILRALPGMGVDVLVVLHDFTLASRLAETIVVLDEDGQIASMGEPSVALDPGTLGEIFKTPFLRISSAAGEIVVPEIGGRAGAGETV